MKFTQFALPAIALAASFAAFADDAVAPTPPAAVPQTTPAPPAPASAAAPTAVAADDAAGSKVICRREVQVGTLIPGHICKTAAQWQLDRDNARKMMGDMQEHTGTTFGK